MLTLDGLLLAVYGDSEVNDRYNRSKLVFVVTNLIVLIVTAPLPMFSF